MLKEGKAILICGKICSGKTTYAKKLCKENRAALLSVDEIMLSLFGQHCGDMHDEYAARTQEFLFEKSVELCKCGIDVILDWGFWTKKSRERAKDFYRSRNIECEFHYIDICDKKWHAYLKKRNDAVLSGESLAYFVDENLAAKFASRFEMPNRDEIDVWLVQTD